MAQPLFFEPDVQFEKVASEVMLPEDANAWPNEIMQELFKQVPFVADFEPHVTMDRVDAERGYGFGHVEIQNKTEIQHGAAPDAMAAAGIKSARIPIVIKDRKLQPLDLLVTSDSKVLPLTEARLRQVIFRPQVFDITGRGPGDMSMIGQLYPPYRQNYGFGGGGATMNVGMGKEGSTSNEDAAIDLHYRGGPYTDQELRLMHPYVGQDENTKYQRALEHAKQSHPAGDHGLLAMRLHMNGSYAEHHSPTMNVGMGKEGSTAIRLHRGGGFLMHHNGEEYHVPRGMGLQHFPELEGAHDAEFGKGGWGPEHSSGTAIASKKKAQQQKATQALDERAYLQGIFRNPDRADPQDRAHALAWAKNHPETWEKKAQQQKAASWADYASKKQHAHVVSLAEKHGWESPQVKSAIHGLTQKTKKKEGSVLAAILPTISEADYNAFFQKVSSDRGLQAQYVANGPAIGESLTLLANYEPATPEKLASAALENLTPTVVQLRKDTEGYTLKTASHTCWIPEERHLDRGEALRLLGEKIVLAADMTGAATMTLGEGVSEAESPEKDSPELVSEFGIYKVQDEQGRHLIGYVFPNLIDLDGTALPMAMFTNGSQMAVQGEIAGVPAGSGVSLFEGHPRGFGAFYHLLQNGRAEATIPMTVKATMAAPEQGGVILHAETYDGRSVQVIVQPNIQNVMPSPDGDHLLIPDTFSWLPLDQSEQTALVSDPGGFNKEGQARQALATVDIRHDGMGNFSIQGFPVDKLASAERDFVSVDDAMFILGALGANQDYVLQKLGQAGAFSAPVAVRVGRYIKTASMRLDEAHAAASDVLAEAPMLKVDLFKEAAVIPDPVAVDTVLSLGFLNPENLGVFISYMPTLDEAQHKMCELLLAARLGLREIPVPALEKAVRSTEQALEGLKVLAFQK